MYKIFLVDDEELERKVLWYTLQNSDLPVTLIGEAANGREAIEQVNLTRPDLIIMDIKMPGINGIEATKQIKARYPDTEIIILTAYGMFSYSLQAIKAQATDYLLKPIQPDKLIEAVSKALERISCKKSRFHLGPAIDLTGLSDKLTTGTLSECKAQLTLLLDKLAAVEQPHLADLINSFGVRLLVIVVQAVLAGEADPAKITDLEKDLVHDLSYVLSLEDLRSWSNLLLEKFFELLAPNKEIGQIHNIVRNTIAYIEACFADNISLNSAADHVHISPAYLSRIFSDKTGIGFNDYLTQVRLKKAKQLLRQSCDTIDQIAALTGFKSSSYFSAVFKKYEKITPSEYRTGQIN